ncbi:MAG: DNA polymerase III subunit beta [Flavobacteriales bacterium]|nr:DNA polymerase III subunit beta [Flavobacteriales bacterium]
MKFIVSSSALLKGLQKIGGVLNTSNTLPILDNFLFELNDGNLSISASDLETTMTTILSVESKEGGKTAVPARLLMDTLKTFADQPLTFLIDAKTHAIEISSEHGKYKLAGENGEEFPKVPELDSASTLSIKAEILERAIAKTLFATGSDELRPVMSGVFFEMSPEHITFVATDAHKLVRYIRTDAKANQASSFIMPKKPLNLLRNALNTTDGEVSIEFNVTNAKFTLEGLEVICRLIDGKYPNYDAVIPKTNPNKLTIDRDQIMNSIKRVSIFSNKTTHQVRLKISGSELQVSAEDIDFNNEATERLTCQYEGKDMEIGFNSRFLADILTNLEGNEVCLEMSEPNRAGIFCPKSPEEGEDTLMLVMPVMLSGN